MAGGRSGGPRAPEQRRPRPFQMPAGASCQMSLCSFNIRGGPRGGGSAPTRQASPVKASLPDLHTGIMDRYDERLPLLRAALREMDADVIAFQEILTGEYAQASPTRPCVFPSPAERPGGGCSVGFGTETPFG